MNNQTSQTTDTFLQALSDLPDLLIRVQAALEAATKVIESANEQLDNSRFFEDEAAHYLHVKKDTLYRYRMAGLPFEKVGRVISYRRKDLDAWRSEARTQHVAIC